MLSDKPTLREKKDTKDVTGRWYHYKRDNMFVLHSFTGSPWGLIFKDKWRIGKIVDFRVIYKDKNWIKGGIREEQAAIMTVRNQQKYNHDTQDWDDFPDLAIKGWVPLVTLISVNEDTINIPENGDLLYHIKRLRQVLRK
jgi:hypothetical protein